MVSMEQAAATPIWAAVAPVLEGEGGRYLANCAISEEVVEGPVAPRAGDTRVAGHAGNERDALMLAFCSMMLARNFLP